MSGSTTNLRKKIGGAKVLQGVVRTMKSAAAASIGQYENSVNALADYSQIIEIGLGACFRKNGSKTLTAEPTKKKEAVMIGAVVFGSDQGLVGRFNDVVADYAVNYLKKLSGKLRVWAVGERVYARLADAKLPLIDVFAVPHTVKAISPLVGHILLEQDKQNALSGSELYLFYNQPIVGAAFNPIIKRLLPLDEEWRKTISNRPWPPGNLPEILGDNISTMQALIQEYLFVSLFRASAESLASENASRLTAMQRADKNISELLENLNGKYHRLRQNKIDEELFDIVTGFEALSI